MKHFFAIGIGLFLVLSTIVYGVFAVLSENREYGKFSLDHFLLTPPELSKISVFCEDNPKFFYSSADGPKPEITHLRCLIEEAHVIEYLERNQFLKISSKSYKKAKIEIELENNGADKINRITAYTYF